MTARAAKPAVEKHYSTKEAAALLGLSQRTVGRLCADREITWADLGRNGDRRIKIPESALAAYVAARTQRAQKKAAS